MGVMVKFAQSGAFNAGEDKFLELEKISELRITRMRNSCELHAITPENPRPSSPYVIARRCRENELKEIYDDLVQLKKVKKDIIYEITDTEAHQVS